MQQRLQETHHCFGVEKALVQFLQLEVVNCLTDFKLPTETRSVGSKM